MRGNVLLRIQSQIRLCGQQSGYRKLGEASHSRLRERLVESRSIVRHQVDPSCQLDFLLQLKLLIVLKNRT